MKSKKQKKTIDLICENCQIPTRHLQNGYLVEKALRDHPLFKAEKDVKLYTCMECKGTFCYSTSKFISNRERLKYMKK